jgi:hypothetical protein
VTFQTDTFAVDGNTRKGVTDRLALAAAGSSGVVGALDCLVTQTTPSATGALLIAPGAIIAQGQEIPFQGAYSGYNVGNDTVSPASTGGSVRSDLIVARVEDPTFSGSSWGGPASGQIVFARIISGVSSSATALPAGVTGVVLARIDIPVSTTIFTNAMITDLRTVADPQVTHGVLTQAGPGTPTNSTASATPVQWPTGATWQVPVPVWATAMQATWSISQLLWNADGNVRGNIYPVIGTSVTAPTVAFNQPLISFLVGEGDLRHSFQAGGSVSIPASIRGTTQTVQFAQKADGTNPGTQAWNEGGFVTLNYRFIEQAAAA